MTVARKKANVLQAVDRELGELAPTVVPQISDLLDRVFAVEAPPLGSTKKQRVLQTVAAEYGEGLLPAIFHAVDRFVAGEACASRDPPASSFAQRNTWKQYQFFQQPPQFLAYRGSLAAKPHIPLVLVHESFSKFALDLESEDTILTEQDYEIAEHVYGLFTEGFDDEVRQMNGGQQLSNLFDVYLDTMSITQLRDIKMDALMMFTFSTKSLLLIAFDDKTDDGPNGYFEGLEVCRRVFLRNASLSHGILVLRACPYMVIIALIMDRKSNTLLSEPLAHVPFWGPEYRTVLQGARAMRALRNFAEGYVSESNIDTSLPFFIAAWQDVSPLNKSGLVLRGNSEGSCMVAKFTQNYSCEAHEAWHEKRLAPWLYGVKNLGSGWKVITMEYLSEGAGWRSLVEVPPDDKLRNLLTEIVNKGHETGYVHGDFRPCNLLINDNNSIQVIDFEWSGLEDIARYPVKPNPELSWEPTVRRGAVLKKNHDLWLVNNFSVESATLTQEAT